MAEVPLRGRQLSPATGGYRTPLRFDSQTLPYVRSPVQREDPLKVRVDRLPGSITPWQLPTPSQFEPVSDVDGPARDDERCVWRSRNRARRHGRQIRDQLHGVRGIGGTKRTRALNRLTRCSCQSDHPAGDGPCTDVDVFDCRRTDMWRIGRLSPFDDDPSNAQKIDTVEVCARVRGLGSGSSDVFD
jgi:hypothetical protein